MRYFTSIRHLRKQLLIITMTMVAVPSLVAQTSNPKGLYRLKEIVHQDGKHLEAGYQQYKYCLDNLTLTLAYNPSQLKNIGVR